MRGTTVGRILALALVGTSLAGCGREAGNETTAQSQAACDRACIIEATNGYIAALAANDPSAAPLAEGVRFVENLQPLKPGEGLWKTATGGQTDFSIHVPDEAQQQAGWLGVIENQGKPTMLAIRLKFDGDRIVEAEHILVEPSEGKTELVQRPRAGFLAEIPAGQRMAHDELLKLGATYYDAVDDNDGSLMPFAADCQRYENGFIAAGEGANPVRVGEGRAPVATGCAEQLDSNAMAYIDRIDNRRMIAADPVTGLAMGFSHFRHPLDNLPFEVTLSDGTKGERNATNMRSEPFDMPAAHIFKVGPDRKVHEIEAIGFVAPYNSPTGWE